MGDKAKWSYWQRVVSVAVGPPPPGVRALYVCCDPDNSEISHSHRLLPVVGLQVRTCEEYARLLTPSRPDAIPDRPPTPNALCGDGYTFVGCVGTRSVLVLNEGCVIRHDEPTLLHDDEQEAIVLLGPEEDQNRRAWDVIESMKAARDRRRIESAPVPPGQPHRAD